MEKTNELSQIYRHIADTLNISNTKTDEIISSYEAVGKYLSEKVEGIDIKIYPQGSLALGTLIQPLQSDRNGSYDVDMVCLLKEQQNMSSINIKNLIGNHLKESDLYRKKLENEGKRCWTLQYADFHMDILPAVPKNYVFNDTSIRLTHKENEYIYTNRYSNPKEYIYWFIEEMKSIYSESINVYAQRKELDIEEVPLYSLRTPLQMAIQLLKRHRDIMFEGKENKPISIIITTLAARAYDGERDLFETLNNILDNMEKYIEYNEQGNVVVKNPTLEEENFADKWIQEPAKKVAFYNWLKQAKLDLIEGVFLIDEGLDSIQDYLSKSFGEILTNESFESYGKEILSKREQGELGVKSTAKITEDKTKMTTVIKNHQFYGK